LAANDEVPVHSSLDRLKLAFVVVISTSTRKYDMLFSMNSFGGAIARL
jgi:hypothetical protein